MARGRSASAKSLRDLPVIALLVGGALLLLVAAALILFLVADRLIAPSEPLGGMPLEVVKLTPTAAEPAEATPTGPVATPSTPSTFCETVVSSGETEVAVPLPATLYVADASFPVAITLPATEWQYPSDQPGTAAWVCGTVVNYVLGLQPTAENVALLNQLRPGDEIQLDLSNGRGMLFRFSERKELPANAAAVLEQLRPRLSLFTRTEGGQWLVAIADYVAETEASPPTGAQAQIGQSVRIGNVEIVANKGHVLRSVAGLAPETMYYLVEFSVTNLGTAPLRAADFEAQLQDNAGNTYLPAPAASAMGENGPLAGQIAAGATVQGTSGYVVPEALAGPVVWHFSPSPGSELQALFRIPYEAPARPEPGTSVNLEVAINDVFMSRDGNVIIIEGEVRNVGDTAATIVLSDISMTSSAGMSELRMAAPPLPWRLEPDANQVVELQFSKPDASAALLTVWGYSFEIEGIR